MGIRSISTMQCMGLGMRSIMQYQCMGLGIRSISTSVHVFREINKLICKSVCVYGGRDIVKCVYTNI